MLSWLCLLVVLLAVEVKPIEIDNHTLVIQNVPKFPFPLGDPFQILIVPKSDNILQINLELGILVVKISDSTTLETDLAIFDLGSKEIFDSKFVGHFMSITVLETDLNKLIKLTIDFTKRAHLRELEIFYINVATSKERSMMLDNLKLADNIYRSKVNLLIRTPLELTINSNNDSVVELYQGTRTVALCISRSSTEKIAPYFLNLNKFMKKTITLPHTKDRIELKFIATVKNHQQNLTCQAGTTKTSIKLVVFHEPSKVKFSPSIKNKMGNGSSVICKPVNGYPEPRISWLFVDGPMNASQYYQIDKSSSLVMKPNAPVGSKWEFICQSSNVINKSENIYNKSLSFTVENAQVRKAKIESIKKPGKCEEKLLKETFKMGVKLELSNKHIKSHQIEIYKLKLKNIEQDREISKMKQIVKKLNVEMSKLKNFVTTEIQSIKKNPIISKNEIKKEHDLVNKTTTTVASKKKEVSMEATFYNVRQLIRKQKHVKSRPFHFRDLGLLISLRLEYYGLNYMKIIMRMSLDPFKTSIRGVATITVFNAYDRSFNKQLSQEFGNGQRMQYVNFNFKYSDLYQGYVFQKNDIIVRCSLQVY